MIILSLAEVFYFLITSGCVEKLQLYGIYSTTNPER